MLPDVLVPPSKRALVAEQKEAAEESGFALDPTAPPAALAARAAAASPTSLPWVVTPSERATYDKFFAAADKGKTGLVTGGQVMRIFMSSQLSKATLAHVW